MKRDREVRDIWQELGLEEMSNLSDDNLSSGSQGSELSDSDSPESSDEDVTDSWSGASSDGNSDTLPDSKRQRPVVYAIGC